MTATTTAPASAATLFRAKRPTNRGRVRATRAVGSFGYHAFMVIVVAAYVFPVVWALSMSFRTNEHMFDVDQLIPHPFTLEHYENLFKILPDFARYFGNTAVIAILGTAGTLFSSSLAGYALARFRFPGSGLLLTLLLLTLMVPGQATLIPQYVLFRDLGWLNTPLPVIVPLLFGSALASFFFRQYFLTLPRELEQAAAIDGAGPWRTFFRIMVPLAGPAYLAMGLLTFVGLWNSFFVNAVYLTTQDSWVLTQALQSLVGRYNSQYGEIMAGVVLVSLPIVIAYFIFQRWIIRGIAMSGLAN